MLYTVFASGSYEIAHPRAPTERTLFEDASAQLNHVQRENDFDDFVRQPLLPKRLSRPGLGVAWHDLDGDGDDDLIVGTGMGGVPGVFINNGAGAFLNLFVGGRVIPGKYPEPASSMLLRNDDGQCTPTVDPAFSSLGLVNGAVFSDLDGDGDPDLALALDWGPVTILLNEGGTIQNATETFGLAGTRGWWNGITAGDFDEDGRMDLIAANWGETAPYRPGDADHSLKIFRRT